MNRLRRPTNRIAALDAMWPALQLTFADHVHELDAGERGGS
jgi:hypothetical protein